MPELLAADKQQPVFVVEGEKDVDNLTALGLLATTNSGGALNWRPEYSDTLKNRDVVIVDDMITTGGSMAQAIRAARSNGARKVVAVATHAVFLDRAVERLADARADEIVVTDTIPLRIEREKAGFKLTVLSVAPILGEAIRRIHFNESVSSLFV